MAGFLSQWILRRVVRSALAFEGQSIAAYQGLRSRLKGGRSCPDALEESLCHLLAEQELHRNILADTASGRLTADDLEAFLRSQLYTGLQNLKPLDEDTLARWGRDLESALAEEEKTWIFYGNLRRMSKIPAVRRAFEVLAAMEKEHVDVLRRLLGRSSGG